MSTYTSMLAGSLETGTLKTSSLVFKCLWQRMVDRTAIGDLRNGVGDSILLGKRENCMHVSGGIPK